MHLIQTHFWALATALLVAGCSTSRPASTFHSHGKPAYNAISPVTPRKPTATTARAMNIGDSNDDDMVTLNPTMADALSMHGIIDKGQTRIRRSELKARLKPFGLVLSDANGNPL